MRCYQIVYFTYLLFLILSCKSREQIISTHPFLIGKWVGDGRLLDIKTNNEIGTIKIEIDIRKDETIRAKVGDAKLINPKIYSANYGFEIRGKLDSSFKNGHLPKKDHCIILFVLDKTKSEPTISDANFHLKSNFYFDYSMQVGGVLLKKE